MIPRRLVIGYDGSDDARRAITVAAELCEVGSALIVCVWDGPVPAAVVEPLDGAPSAAVPAEVSLAAAERGAIRRAREGADLARECGLAPEFATRQASGVNDVARALVEAAEAWNGDLIVVGRRDMSRVRAVLLGSVSNAVVHVADRPVLVVPVAA